VTLEANGQRLSRDVVVEGDPLLPLTQADYEAREAFLVGLLRFQEECAEFAARASGRQRELEGEASEQAQQLSQEFQRLRRRAFSLAGALLGFGVRQGSLYPPTRTHRAQADELRARQAELVVRLESLTGGR
jgi:hypothetical protein